MSDLGDVLRTESALLTEMAGVLTDLASRADALTATPVPAPQPILPVVPPVVQPPASDSVLNLAHLVPYRSQWDPDGTDFVNDCGPASVAMVLDYFNIHVDINTLSRDAGLALHKNYTLPFDLIRAAGLHGITLSRRYAFSLAALSLELVGRHPVIVLIHYGALGNLRMDQGWPGGHWCVVVGMDAKNVYIHDPDWKAPRRDEGCGLAVPIDVFQKAWDCLNPDLTNDGNTPHQCLVVEIPGPSKDDPDDR